MALLVGMIGRDVATELPYVLDNVWRLSGYFREVHVMLVENDSGDGTLAVFDAWGRNATAQPGTRVLSVEARSLPSSGKVRKSIETLATARNVYTAALLEPKYANIDLLLAVDTDMRHRWDVETMHAVLQRLLPRAGPGQLSVLQDLFGTHAVAHGAADPSTAGGAATNGAEAAVAANTAVNGDGGLPPGGRDILLANGVCGWYTNFKAPNEQAVPSKTPGSSPVYCDLLALRDVHGTYHTGHKLAFPGGCEGAGALGCVYMAGEALIPVQTAFGGWGLYHAGLIRGCRKEDGQLRCLHEPGECEHVQFQQCLRTQCGARAYISPRLTVDWEGCQPSPPPPVAFL